MMMLPFLTGPDWREMRGVCESSSWRLSQGCFSTPVQEAKSITVADCFGHELLVDSCFVLRSNSICITSKQKISQTDWKQTVSNNPPANLTDHLITNSQKSC